VLKLGSGKPSSLITSVCLWTLLALSSVLDNDLSTNPFAVTYGGQAVPFSGVLPQLSTKDLTPDSFVTIPAGQFVTATHSNIGPLYKFHEAGTGTFTFAPRRDFQVAGVGSVASEITEIVGVGGPSVDIHVGSDVRRRELGIKNDLEKRNTVECSDYNQGLFIADS
jgi:deuterolysin